MKRRALLLSRLLALSLLLAALGADAAEQAVANDQGPALLAEFFSSHDSEALKIYSFSTGYAPYYVTQERLGGVVARQLNFSQPGWALRGEQLAIQQRSKTRDSWTQFELGFTHLGHNSLAGAFNRGWFDDSGRSAEVFAERALVDSRRSIEKNLSATLVGAAADLPLSEHSVATGYLAAQYMEDNNWRSHMRLKLSYELNPAPAAVQVQARVRSIRASNPFTGNYFNPKAFDEVLLGTFIRFDHLDWRLNLWMGAGQQRADGNTRNAYVVEARLQAPRMAEVPVHASLTVGVRRDGARGEGYTYRYIMGNLGVRF
jgi:hypothetical protein